MKTFITTLFCLCTLSSFAVEKTFKRGVQKLLVHQNSFKTTDAPDFIRNAYIFHEILRRPDMSAMEIFTAFENGLWAPELNSEHIDSYILLWGEYEGIKDKGTVADILLAIEPLDETGAAIVAKYLKNHQGMTILKKYIEFNLTQSLLMTMSLKYFDDSYTTTLLKLDQWAMFKNQNEIKNWLTELENSMIKQDKSKYIELLSQKFDKEKVASAAAMFEAAKKIVLDGDLVYLTKNNRSQGHVTSLVGWTAKN